MICCRPAAMLLLSTLTTLALPACTAQVPEAPRSAPPGVPTGMTNSPTSLVFARAATSRSPRSGSRKR